MLISRQGILVPHELFYKIEVFSSSPQHIACLLRHIMSSVETVPLLTPRNRRDNKWAVVSLCTTLFLVIIILAILFPAGPHPIAGLSRIPLQYELRQILFLSKYTIEESNPPLIECRRASIDHPYHIKEQDAFVNAKIIPLGSSNNYTILEEHRDNDGNLTLYATGSAQIIFGFSNSILVNMEGDPCQYKITISLFNKGGNIENRCQKGNQVNQITKFSFRNAYK